MMPLRLPPRRGFVINSPDMDAIAMRALFNNGALGGYWPADPAYLYEDSAGTISASLNGVVGLLTNAVTGYPNAIQATTANKPYLRRTPVSNKYWLDSNTTTGALTATFASALGRRNLLTYTEDFSNAVWFLNTGSVTVTPNSVVSPDGTTSGLKVTETTTAFEHFFEQTITVNTNQSYSSSVYVKAGNTASFSIVVVAVGSSTIVSYAWFSITGGVISANASAGIISSSIVIDVGGGWYRCIVFYTLNGTVTSHRQRIYPKNTNNYVGDGTSYLYVWHPQLEVGSTPTEYQKIVAGASATLDTTALAATYPQNITASINCTIACVTAEGVVIADNQTVGTTYNIAPPYGYNSDVLIINRALTAAEKALVTRVMQRDIPAYGSLVNAIPQMRGYSTNNEMQIDWSTKTSFIDYWRYGGNYLSSFPLINTAAGTNFDFTWYGCSSLTSFPLINTAAGTSFCAAWYLCSSLTSFPLINTAAGTNFDFAWYGCSSLTSFPLINTAAGTSFYAAWNGCSSLTSFPLINTAAGTSFSYAWYLCSSLTSFPLINTAAGTRFDFAWRGCSGLTSFPLINTAAGTNFDSAWWGCSGLTSFPLINTAAGTSFSYAWAGCSGLTSFPLINTAAGTNFSYAWFGCSGLTSFPANFFDSWTGVPIADCFSRTWDSCIKLTLASVQNIVVSLVVSGKSAPATGTDISLDGAPTLVAIQADTTVMTAVATLKSRNWTPKYKGTAL